MPYDASKVPTATAGSLLNGSGIRFQRNDGQIIGTDGKAQPDVLFSASVPGASLFLRKNGISTVFARREKYEYAVNVPREFRPERIGNRLPRTDMCKMEMTLVGCNPSARIRMDDELEGVSNYYLAHCPNGILGVKDYGTVVYENIYDRIDLKLLSVNGTLKYEFYVHPGGRVSDIRMKYDNATKLRLKEDGILSISTRLGKAEEASPVSFTGEEKDTVASRFVLRANTISFSIDAYDTNETLVIDPWATYYGGTGDDDGENIAVDGSGNIFVSGSTTSNNFPISSSPFQGSNAGDYDAFVVKFDGNGVYFFREAREAPTFPCSTLFKEPIAVVASPTRTSLNLITTVFVRGQHIMEACSRTSVTISQRTQVGM
ncbi:MAG: SBBP repeat-containing protein [Ignavibacteria bacterium]|nr:SBBP repeat-containing protein [Ignavibacteria bacterium]